MKNTVWDDIYKLDKVLLGELLYQYDQYVIEVTDREDGSVPVCVAEFYDNEWQDILEQLKTGE